MVMFVAEDAEPEIIRFGDINQVVVSEETVRCYGPVRLRIG